MITSVQIAYMYFITSNIELNNSCFILKGWIVVCPVAVVFGDVTRSEIACEKSLLEDRAGMHVKIRALINSGIQMGDSGSTFTGFFIKHK